ncbi:MAG: pirin family protein [Gordonia sp. (in: high G+C Gram-positive bacteria)]|uniref:pirin family protein n=1 Tax=Gordonia sp. (in: high G+C Gram-positive bacteria) TaxID=84139 RepID=UPI0039E446BF
MPQRTVRAADRHVTETGWLTSRHGFSFGDHYDPDNTHHGMLLVCNDEIVLPGQGFDTHPHAETEIVTWVLSGSLVHQDSRGHSGVIHPGLAQRMSAGTGIEHSERNDHAETSEPVHYIQMWLMPDDTGHDPDYQQRDISTELTAGGLIPVASGERAHDSAIRIRNSGATLWVARLAAGEHVTIPRARFTHLFVTDGAVRIESELLQTGDTLRADDLGGSVLTAVTDAEALIWTMNKTLGE